MLGCYGLDSSILVAALVQLFDAAPERTCIADESAAQASRMYRQAMGLFPLRKPSAKQTSAKQTV